MPAGRLHAASARVRHRRLRRPPCVATPSSQHVPAPRPRQAARLSVKVRYPAGRGDLRPGGAARPPAPGQRRRSPPRRSARQGLDRPGTGAGHERARAGRCSRVSSRACLKSGGWARVTRWCQCGGLCCDVARPRYACQRPRRHAHTGGLVPTVPAAGRHDLANCEWSVLEPLLPAGKKAGRPPKWARRQLIDGIRCGFGPALRGGTSRRATAPGSRCTG